MSDLDSTQKFSAALSALPLSTQRLIGGEFAKQVLHLVSDHRLQQVVDIAMNPGASHDEIQMAYHLAHSVYVGTQPESEYSELDFRRQAEHFVAQACMLCVAPVNTDAEFVHLAQRIAMYCRMAITCSCMPHEQERELDFSHASEETEKLIESQHEILQRYLGSQAAA